MLIDEYSAEAMYENLNHPNVIENNTGLFDKIKNAVKERQSFISHVFDGKETIMYIDRKYFKDGNDGKFILTYDETIDTLRKLGYGVKVVDSYEPERVFVYIWWTPYEPFEISKIRDEEKYVKYKFIKKYGEKNIWTRKTNLY